MPLVELVGPPGVGKSALVAAAIGRGVLDARRVVLDPRPPLPPAAADRMRDAALPRIVRTLAERLLVVPSDARVEAALAAVAPGWGPFLRMVVGGRAQEQDARDRDADDDVIAVDVIAVMERDWMHAALRTRALLERERCRPEVVLLDEGLTHPFKARAVVGRSSTARLEEYAAIVPLPDVLVVLDAPGPTLVERLRDRYRSQPARARWVSLGGGVSEEHLLAELAELARVTEVIATAAERRGCPVVRIATGTLPPAELAQRTIAEVRRAREAHVRDQGGARS